MFSSRTNWNTAPNRLSQLVIEKRLRGESFIDLTESNPTNCGFLYPKKVILNAFADTDLFSYKPDPRGLLSARNAITEYYSGLGISIRPEQIVLTASTSEAYSFLFKLLCNTDDEVIVPQPSYPLLEYLCQLEHVTLRPYRLVYDGEWHIDFASLESQISERTKAIILVHPNNPTGSYIKQDEFDRISTFAFDHRCVIIADEVFGPYEITAGAPRACTLSSSLRGFLFSLNGISKLLGLPQFKLSWIVVQGNPGQLYEALDRLDIIADTFLSLNTPIQIALPKLLQHSSTIEKQIQARILEHHQFLRQQFSNTTVSVLQSEGGWYALLQLPHRLSDDEWAEQLLANESVLVQPGHFYGLEQTSCIVISLLPISSLFKKAILQLKNFIG